MKRTIAIALLSIASLFAIGSASAQDHGVKATVPFEFTAGGRLLPAGTYAITSPSSGVVMIRGIDRHIAILTTALPERDASPGDSKLVFAKYGDQYFLHDVLCPIASLSVNIRTSKLEKQVQRQQAMVNGGEPVLIATR